MESKKINQLATELAPELSDLTIIGDPTTGISKKITLSQMASLFTGTVEEYANLASFPLVGTADTIYIALDTNIIYRWNTGTSAYVELSPNIVTSLVFSDANGFDGTISLVGSTATLTITTALTQGSVPFIGTSGALSQDNANLFFDDTNNRLGINTNTPTTALDVFGSGIIGRLNGTSTNNAFLGFASAGSNKWSIGNVQSDHRFRIYNEATTSELVSVLQTGEFGIGIANPTTKLHIDGGASALIANLDANVSVAKSISFRSDNSNRFNIEVSGTESGSNAGANFFIRRYSDAGALIDTPLTITRSTGTISLATALSGTSATFSGDLTLDNGSADGAQLVLASSGFSNWNIDNFNGFLRAYYGSSERLRITSGGELLINATSNGAPNLGYQLGVRGTNANTQISIALANQTLSTQGCYIGLDGTVGYFHMIDNKPWTFATNNIERMRIANNGSVGIGTSSPDNLLDLYGTGTNTTRIRVRGTTNFALFQAQNDSSSAFYMGIDSSTASGFNVGNYSRLIWSGGAYPLVIATNDAERLRITSGGYLKASNTGTYGAATGNYHEILQSGIGSAIGILTHTAGSPYGIEVAFSGADPNNTTNYMLGMYTSSPSFVWIYRIWSNGTVSARSDARWKKNIETTRSGYLEDLCKLRVVKYNWYNHEDNAPKELGLIAQEVEEVFPNLIQYDKVTTKKQIEQEDGTFIEQEIEDGESRSIKTSVLPYMLLKALQEANQKIEELTNRIIKLESK